MMAGPVVSILPAMDGVCKIMSTDKIGRVSIGSGDNRVRVVVPWAVSVIP